MQPHLTKQLTNYDVKAIVTPINVNRLTHLMRVSGYDEQEAEFLISGFTQGFKLGYQGPRDVKIISNNLRLWVGNQYDLWDKVMGEVQAKRYAGPYESPEEIFPLGYMVNPIGLVEKPGKPNKTRLINHYSYPPGASVNDHIPDSYSKVQYQDFQDAIKIALNMLKNSKLDHPDLHFSKTDQVNAFRVLPIAFEDRCLQMLKARNPLTNKYQFFVDLSCGFGSSSSCFLYDKISRVLRHLYHWRTGEEAVVYLDDGLQIGLSEQLCNANLDAYLLICQEISLPTSEEKTVRATRIIVFLGLLIDGLRRLVAIPELKVSKALNQIDVIVDAKKATVLQMQRITGLLNFFCRAIIPGRAFTRRLYAEFAHINLRPHHHIKVTNEMKLDLGVWRKFMAQDQSVLRPFVDFDDEFSCKNISLSADAAKSEALGFATCYWHSSNNTVFYAFDRWEPALLQKYDPSVQFLELIGFSAGVILFAELFKHSSVSFWCDNQAVVQMVNNGASGCKHCMKLI